jgi:FtsZ-interacting cell division protein ZipA
MSTGLIILIVVVALLLIGLLVMLPRMRAKSQERKAQRELESRRDRVATEHRETASARATEADRAEQEAEIAQQKARAERAEAERHEAEAKMHERGLADDKLVEDHERDRFAGVTGDNGTEADRRDDRVGRDDDAAYGDADRDRTTAAGDEPAARRATAGDETADRSNTEYQQGREDERIAEERTRGT